MPEPTEAMVEKLALRTFNCSRWVVPSFHFTEEDALWKRAAPDLREKFRDRARADLEALAVSSCGVGAEALAEAATDHPAVRALFDMLIPRDGSMPTTDALLIAETAIQAWKALAVFRASRQDPQ